MPPTGFDAISSLPISTLPDAGGPPPAAPVAQRDWPNPSLRKQAGQFTVAANLLLTTLAVVVPAPFVQDEWPNPVRAKYVAQIEQAENLRPLQSGPQVAPFNQEDWLNPRGRGRVQPEAQPNLFGTVLAPSVAAPFNQSDWPNPSARRVVQLEQAQNLLALNPSKGIAFSQHDWLNPRGTRPQQPDPQQVNRPLYSGPQVAPFNQEDWPNPRGLRPQQPEILPVSVALLSGPQVAPFNLEDWPLARVAQRAPQFDAPNLLGTTLAPAAAAPFSQTDWQNPRGKVGQQPYAQPVNIALYTGPQVQPFGQDEWLNPRGRRPTQPEAQPNLFGTVLAPAPGTPFVQSDWPNPRGVRPQQPHYQYVSLALYTGTQVAPFNQEDWPTPRARAKQQVEQQQNALTLDPSKGVPFAQDDWRVPTVRGARQQDAVPNLLGTTLAPTALPFSQDAWPNPLQKKWVDLWATPNLLGSTLAPAAAMPFSQMEWRNPIRDTEQLNQGWLQSRPSYYQDVDEVVTRRSKRPVIRPYHEGYGTVQGVEGFGEAGTPFARPVTREGIPGTAFTIGVGSTSEVGQGKVRAGVGGRALPGSLRPVRGSLGEALPHAGVRLLVEGAEGKTLYGRVVACGAGNARTQTKASMGYTGEPKAKGIANPTNEELIALVAAIRLRRRRKRRV